MFLYDKTYTPEYHQIKITNENQRTFWECALSLTVFFSAGGPTKGPLGFNDPGDLFAPLYHKKALLFRIFILKPGMENGAARRYDFESEYPKRPFR